VSQSLIDMSTTSGSGKDSPGAVLVVSRTRVTVYRTSGISLALLLLASWPLTFFIGRGAELQQQPKYPHSED